MTFWRLACVAVATQAFVRPARRIACLRRRAAEDPPVADEPSAVAEFSDSPPLADEPSAVAAFVPAELPLDFGGGNATWTFEWPEGGDAWDGRDVVTGAAGFATCHLLALLAFGPSAAIPTRLAGTGGFLGLQAASGNPLVPLRNGLGFDDVADAFAFGQTVPVARVSPETPWFAVALGATVPVYQAVLVPLFLTAPEGAFSCSASQLPGLADAVEKLAVAPLTEGLVFQFWALEACRNAKLPYAPSVVGAGLAFGLWHGLAPTSLFLAALGCYWGHLHAQTRNLLIPVTMHALWNALTFGVGACVVAS